MNCREIELLLSAERDGALNATQQAALDQHVADCPACRVFRDQLSSTMSALRADSACVRMPDVDAEWHALQARLNSDGAKSGKKRPLAPVIWLSAPLAAAAAIALAFFVNRPSPALPAEGFSPPAEVASAEFVEAGDADASTMVFVDKESGWLVVWATDAEAERSI